jgi:hypothetical protein
MAGNHWWESASNWHVLTQLRQVDSFPGLALGKQWFGIPNFQWSGTVAVPHNMMIISISSLLKHDLSYSISHCRLGTQSRSQDTAAGGLSLFDSFPPDVDG